MANETNAKADAERLYRAALEAVLQQPVTPIGAKAMRMIAQEALNA